MPIVDVARTDWGPVAASDGADTRPSARQARWGSGERIGRIQCVATAAGRSLPWSSPRPQARSASPTSWAGLGDRAGLRRRTRRTPTATTPPATASPRPNTPQQVTRSAPTPTPAGRAGTRRTCRAAGCRALRDPDRAERSRFAAVRTAGHPRRSPRRGCPARRRRPPSTSRRHSRPSSFPRDAGDFGSCRLPPLNAGYSTSGDALPYGVRLPQFSALILSTTDRTSSTSSGRTSVTDSVSA